MERRSPGKANRTGRCETSDRKSVRDASTSSNTEATAWNRSDRLGAGRPNTLKGRRRQGCRLRYSILNRIPGSRNTLSARDDANRTSARLLKSVARKTHERMAAHGKRAAANCGPRNRHALDEGAPRRAVQKHPTRLKEDQQSPWQDWPVPSRRWRCHPGWGGSACPR
jgi:hypothetical protein